MSRVESECLENIIIFKDRYFYEMNIPLRKEIEFYFPKKNASALAAAVFG